MKHPFSMTHAIMLHENRNILDFFFKREIIDFHKIVGVFRHCSHTQFKWDKITCWTCWLPGKKTYTRNNFLLSLFIVDLVSAKLSPNSFVIALTTKTKTNIQKITVIVIVIVAVYHTSFQLSMCPFYMKNSKKSLQFPATTKRIQNNTRSNVFFLSQIYNLSQLYKEKPIFSTSTTTPHHTMLRDSNECAVCRSAMRLMPE